MTPLLSVEQFLERVNSREPFIPRNDDDEPDAARVEIVLSGATGVIVAHLPWLLDKESGEIARPVNPQFADALDAVCADIAVDRMSDPVTGSENTRNRYKESLALLEKIDREYQGGLAGPGLLESCVVESNEADGIEDNRFFKKGRML
jgi:phage gp36-like protein